MCVFFLQHWDRPILLVFLQLFGREGRQPKLCGQVAVGFTNKNKPVGDAARVCSLGMGRGPQQVFERRRECQAGRPQDGRLQELSSADQHYYSLVLRLR
mgnify:CR=1 FL=1